MPLMLEIKLLSQYHDQLQSHSLFDGFLRINKVAQFCTSDFFLYFTKIWGITWQSTTMLGKVRNMEGGSLAQELDANACFPATSSA